MEFLYNQIFYRPIFNVLVYFYQTISFHNLGIAIIETTVLIRLILYPFFHKGAKQQMLMQRIQPDVKKIQEKHKDDKQKQTEELMALYKQHGVNPFMSLLLIIVQLPIMLAINWILRAGITTAQFSNLYSFIHAPATVNPIFFGTINLVQSSWTILIAAALSQFIQARLAIWRAPGGGVPSQAQKIAVQMSYIAPIMTFVIFFALPSAVTLYWCTTAVFSIIQQYFVNKHLQEKYGN